MSDDATLLDQIHALVEGTLPAQEAERLERELAADPEAREMLAEYRAVHELTSVLVQGVPSSSLSLEDVVPQSRATFPRTRRVTGGWRMAAAAALLVGVVGLGTWQALSPSGPGEVELATILAAVSVDAGPERTVPASLQSFTPVTDGGVRWLDSLPEAQRIAEMVGRPVLLFVEFPGCPWCEWMDENTFGADVVRERFGEFVPVRVDIRDLGALSPEEQPEFLRTGFEGWPLLGVMNADGSTVSKFPGKHDAERFRELLDDALDGLGNDPMRWSEAREATTQFLRAEEARGAGRLTEAWERYAQLAAGSREAFSDLGSWGCGVLGNLARERLDEARCAVDPRAALVELDAAVIEFAGTPLGDELALVRDSLRERDAFPDLTRPELDRSER